MTCRELTEFIIDYFEGDLDADERVRFEQHIGRCGTCVQYIETYRETIALGKTAFAEDEPLTTSMPEELVRAILASRTKG